MPVLECVSDEIIIIMSLKEGTHGSQHIQSELQKVCQEYCDTVGVAITIMEGFGIYQYGNEPIARIALAQNPLNTVEEKTLQALAEELADLIGTRFNVKQYLVKSKTITKLFIR